MLEAVAQGDSKAAEELLPLVYEELRKLAAHKMAAELPGQTLQPTALVHEAWLRLAGDDAARFANRAHFIAAAAEAMRRILIETTRLVSLASGIIQIRLPRSRSREEVWSPTMCRTTSTNSHSSPRPHPRRTAAEAQ